MAKIRIAYLQHGLHYGGAAISLFLLQKSIKNNIFEKYLFLTPSSSDSKDLKNIFLKQNQGLYDVKLGQIHNHQCARTPFYKFLFLKHRSCDDLLQYLENLNIDILHINSTVFPQILGKIKSNISVKIVTHIRELINNNNMIGEFMVNQIYNYSDAIIAISDNEARPFLGHHNLYVLPNPFDFSKLKSIKSSFRKEYNISNDCVIIGMLGQFHRFKGHLVFLQAIREIINKNSSSSPVLFLILGTRARGPLWKIVARKILGRENYLEIVENYIREHKLERYIRLIPYTLDIFGALKAMDIVVRPSLSADPWGRDIIEAMALGKPMVATGTSEFYIKHGETGYLVPPNQPQLMAEKILDLINNPDKRKILGEKGYLKVRAMCDLVQYGQKISQIYNSIDLKIQKGES